MHDIRQPSDLLNLLPLIHDDTLPSCTSTSAAVLQAAMDGGGIALVRSLLVSADLKAGRLVRLLPDISIPSPPAYLVYCAESCNLPQVCAFREWMKAEGKEGC
jgi:hypothetical protein